MNKICMSTTTLPEAGQFYPAYLARLRERVGAGLFDTVSLTHKAHTHGSRCW